LAGPIHRLETGRASSASEPGFRAHHRRYAGARRPLHWGFPERVRGEYLIAALRFASVVLLLPVGRSREGNMQLTPREFDKLLIYMMADVALKRKAQGLKLNYPEAVSIISSVALDGARAGKTIEDVTKDAGAVLTKADVMDGVADLVPMIQIEAVFTDGSRLVTVHTPIQ
jgi:urease subunit gamma